MVAVHLVGLLEHGDERGSGFGPAALSSSFATTGGA